ncbi:conserved hypothetical protein [Trichinella spiralis]|uniref:hypothetical protein n=1 Tax=Trichinella spiralis TaxID=6334 RepID=UPI0001EFE582|nr:conserved hypothetical protein [Trichinella spiralis]
MYTIISKVLNHCTGRCLEQARPLLLLGYWRVHRYLATGQSNGDVTTNTHFSGNLPTAPVNNQYRSPPPIFMSYSSYGSLFSSSSFSAGKISLAPSMSAGSLLFTNERFIKFFVLHL